MKSLFVLAFALMSVPSFAGGINCTPQGCAQICGQQECSCNPAQGYTCGGTESAKRADPLAEILGGACCSWGAGQGCFPGC